MPSDVMKKLEISCRVVGIHQSEPRDSKDRADAYDRRPLALYAWPVSVEPGRSVEARNVIMSRFLERYPEKAQWQWEAVVYDVQITS